MRRGQRAGLSQATPVRIDQRVLPRRLISRRRQRAKREAKNQAAPTRRSLDRSVYAVTTLCASQVVLGMNVLTGSLLSVAGVVMPDYGIAMLMDYRRVATRYWESIFKWHERYNRLWRTTRAQSVRRMPVLRAFGGIVFAIIGIGWLLVGICLSFGYLR